jgi:5-methylcytosine-specific restriction endonuclease McrA
MLADGEVTLTTVSLLASKLTDENHEALLAAASHKSRRDVEHLVARLSPKPDVRSSVRRLPEKRVELPVAVALEMPPVSAATAPLLTDSAPPRRALVAPLAPNRYLLKVTLSDEAHNKLERARALLRHQIPTGDPAAIVERALTVLVEQLEKTKHASTTRPKTTISSATSTSRHVPAEVKRAVWARDEGRCAFVGTDGRCEEIGFLEFHHVVPFAAGGPTDVGNLQLRCRAHNAYEAALFEQSWEGSHFAES